jgi:beta-mannosidase
VALAPGEAVSIPAFELVGRFFDLAYAYRFGPRAHAAVSARLFGEGGDLLGQAVHLPPGVEAWEPGTITAELCRQADGWGLTLTADRLQRFVKLADPWFEPDDDWLTLLPGEPRRLRLVPRTGAAPEAVPHGEARLPGGHVAGAWRG